jgi:L-ribulose-5-phosphate 4-epimerase
MSRWQREKELVVAAARHMAARGLVTGASGNVSLRLEAKGKTELLAVTPSSLPYETMKPDDIQVVSFEGGTVEGTLKPSVETGLHVGIYKARRNVDAVIHTHSVYASALAMTGRSLPPLTDSQVISLGGEIRCAPYAPSGSPELGTFVLEALGDRSGVLLQNHGAIGTGKDLEATLAACELLETTARIYLLALGAGDVAVLPEDAVTYWKAWYDRDQGPAV